MGWIRKMAKRIIFAVLVVGLLGSWGVMAAQNAKSLSNEESKTMLSKNLCDYAITDYEKIKPEILSMFPIGMSEEELRKRLAEFPLSEARGKKIYEQPLLKIENGQRVVENGEVVWSKKAKYLFAMIECKLPDNNKNRWSFEFLMDESGVISENIFVVSVDDENFAKRNIELKVSYLAGSTIIAKVISSIATENYPDWNSLRDYLSASGLSPSKKPTLTDDGNKSYTVYLNSDLLDSLYLKIGPGVNWRITVIVDKNGKFIRAYR